MSSLDKNSSASRLQMTKDGSNSRNGTPKTMTSELSKIMLQRLEKINFKEGIDELSELTYKHQDFPLIQGMGHFITLM